MDYHQSRLRTSILPIDYCVALSLCYMYNKLCQNYPVFGNTELQPHIHPNPERELYFHMGISLPSVWSDGRCLL